MKNIYIVLILVGVIISVIAISLGVYFGTRKKSSDPSPAPSEIYVITGMRGNNSGNITYSYDLETWNQTTYIFGTDNADNFLGQGKDSNGDNLWIAVGKGSIGTGSDGLTGRRFYESNDGVNWTDKNFVPSHFGTGVGVSGTSWFIGVSPGTSIYFSNGGETFTSSQPISSDNTYVDFAFSDDTVVAVGSCVSSNTTGIVYSKNYGVSWETTTGTSFSEEGKRVYYANSNFVAIGDYAPLAYWALKSSDGEIWEPIPGASTIPGIQISGSQYNGTSWYFVVTSATGTSLFTADSSLTTYTEACSSLGMDSAVDFRYYNEKYFILANPNDFNDNMELWSSEDGLAWSKKNAPVPVENFDKGTYFTYTKL